MGAKDSGVRNTDIMFQSRPCCAPCVWAISERHVALTKGLQRQLKHLCTQNMDRPTAHLSTGYGVHPTPAPWRVWQGGFRTLGLRSEGNCDTRGYINGLTARGLPLIGRGKRFFAASCSKAGAIGGISATHSRMHVVYELSRVRYSLS